MEQTQQILIFDTTLRDGEQSPGASLGVEDKVEIARQLDRLNVDIIEAGFPNSSPGQFEAVRRIADEIPKTIAALARTKEEDIRCASEALKNAKRSRIHTFIGVSDQHVLGKFGAARYGASLAEKRKTVIQMAFDSIRFAKSLCDEVEFSPEDALRADFEYLVDVIGVALDAGVTTINIPDTTGFAHPQHFGRVIADLHSRIPRLRDFVVSAHCHDDLGLSVANSLAAIENGARQVECTINGIGERAGNASLEEIVMALRVRSDFYQFKTGIRSEELFATSQLVSERTGMLVQPNKAIVGANAFAHESGIHQDGVLKSRDTYEIMTPESVGVSGTKIALGKHSGRHGLQARLKSLGFAVADGSLPVLYAKFLALAESKKEITDEDLQFLMEGCATASREVYQLEQMHVMTGNQAPSSATVTLRIGDKVQSGSSFGQGPIEACFSAVDSITHLRPRLEKYEVKSRQQGLNSLGDASVSVREGDRVFVGRGVSIDIVDASLRAYIDACNQHLLYRWNRSRLSAVADERDEEPRSLAW